ncbi:MAG: EpsG family protein [Albidovulum sp.]
MFPYIALAASVSGFSLLDRYYCRNVGRISDQARTWGVWDALTVVVLISFSALRYRVGTDFDLYLVLYKRLYVGNWIEQLATSPQEFGFTLMSLVLRENFKSPYALLWATSVLTVVPAYAAMKKRSADMPMSIVLYVLLAFFVGPFNIIRQGIAVSLSFWADTFREKNRPIWITLNIVASSFHASVILVVALQWVVRRFKIGHWHLLGVIVCAWMGAAFILDLPIVLKWLSALNPRYATYAISEERSGIGTYLMLASRIALVGYAVFLAKGQRNQWLAYCAVGIGFLAIGTQSVVVSRLEIYFGIYLTILLPNLMKERGRSDLERLTIVAASAVYFVFYLSRYGGLLPYQTYL